MKFGVADKTLDIVNNDTGDFNLVLHGVLQDYQQVTLTLLMDNPMEI